MINYYFVSISRRICKQESNYIVNWWGHALLQTADKLVEGLLKVDYLSIQLMPSLVQV